MKSVNNVTLRELRERKKLTQRQMAALLGVREATVVDWETGAKSPSPLARTAIARLMRDEMRVIADRGLRRLPKLVRLVKDENQRQLYKWGTQYRTPSEWIMFVAEEFGELAEAVGEVEYRQGNSKDVVAEAIQVATLALKIAEMYGGGEK